MPSVRRARLRSRPTLANRKIRQQLRQSRTSVKSSPSIGSSTCSSHRKEKRHGLENTSHRRDRCRHGNQHLRLRRPVIFAASQPRHSQGRSPRRPSCWGPPPVAVSLSGIQMRRPAAVRVPAMRTQHPELRQPTCPCRRPAMRHRRARQRRHFMEGQG